MRSDDTTTSVVPGGGRPFITYRDFLLFLNGPLAPLVTLGQIFINTFLFRERERFFFLTKCCKKKSRYNIKTSPHRHVRFGHKLLSLPPLMP